MVASGSQTFALPLSGEPASSGRNPDGTFASGNTASLTHGARSRQVQGAQLPEQTDRSRHLAEKRAAIVTDLGGEASLSRLQLDLVDRYLELDAVAAWLGGNLVAVGPLSAKGRTRAALTAYVSVADRVLRIAAALGLDRQQRTVSLTEYLGTAYGQAEAHTTHQGKTSDASGP